MPQPIIDHGAALPAAPDGTDHKAVSLADTNSSGMGTAPPHLLWETLESAFSGPDIRAPEPYGPPVPTDERLARYIAMPIVLGLSLVLWVVIVELVLMR